jgi:uncharacterized damage-inducible protein DinB
MTPVSVRELYAYDRWANRRLFDAVSALPPSEVTRIVGTQFSRSTLRGMLVHILGAQVIWLQRCQGESPTSMLQEGDVPDLPALRARWDSAEGALQQFAESLTEADLRRIVQYRNARGEPFALPLWVLLQHVANHSTHHRSEVATMLTMVTGSPPPTDLVVYHLLASGQAKE